MPPIKPSEVNSVAPEVVFECFNFLIQQNYSDGESIVKIGEVRKLMKEKGLSADDIEKNLNIESAYRKAGWKVEYDKPGFNETYEGFYTFTKPRKKNQ